MFRRRLGFVQLFGQLQSLLKATFLARTINASPQLFQRVSGGLVMFVFLAHGTSHIKISRPQMVSSVTIQTAQFRNYRGRHSPCRKNFRRLLLLREVAERGWGITFATGVAPGFSRAYQDDKNFLVCHMYVLLSFLRRYL